MSKEELELLRQRAVRKITVTSLIVIVISVVVSEFLSSYELMFHLLFIGFLVVTPLVSHNSVKRFKDAYKKNIILELFKTLFTEIKYLPDRGIARHILDETNMINTGDKFYSEDYIVAKYKNVSFEFSDVKIEEEYRDSDGDKHSVTIFKGQWYIFDFNKRFKADLQVCEKGFRNAKRGSLFSPKKFNKVQLEDIEFNKEFNVFAQNTLDAFYVLTPSIMEKIKELNNKVYGKLLFCFVNNKLHVGLHSGKNLFEPKLYKKIDIEKNHAKAIEEIKTITHFVDILDLDNDLFRREV